mgnify:FL=1
MSKVAGPVEGKKGVAGCIRLPRLANMGLRYWMVAVLKISNERGIGNLGRIWKPKESDMTILGLLYRFKYLRAKTLVAVLDIPEKRAYERLRELTRQGFLLNKSYSDVIELEDGRVFKAKLGTIYYLTRKGIITYKEYAGLEFTDTERTRPPEEDKISRIFKTSIILENIINAGFYPLENISLFSLTSESPEWDGWQEDEESGESGKFLYFRPDFVVNGHFIYYKQSGQGLSFKQIIKGTQELRLTPQYQQGKEIIIIVDTPQQKRTAHEYYREIMGGNDRVLDIKDTTGLKHILTDGKELEEIILNSSLKLQRTDRYTYENEFYQVFDLVGLPKETIDRILLSKDNRIKRCIVSNEEERKILFKVYPDFEKHFEVLTLEETIKKTEEVNPWLQVIQKIKANTN